MRNLFKVKYFGFGVYGYSFLGFKYYWWEVEYNGIKEKHMALDFLNTTLFKWPSDIIGRKKHEPKNPQK